MKTCTKCKSEKPLTEFCKASKRPDGLQKHCKSCNAKYRAANKAKIRAYLADYRESNYGLIQAKKAEYAANNKDKIRAQNARYYAENPEKIKAYKEQYTAKNRERIRANKAEYYARERAKFIAYRKANGDRMRRLARRYYHKNKGAVMAYKAENADSIRAYRAEYYTKNLEKYAQYDRDRRARKLNAEGKHTAGDVRKIFERQRGICAGCNAKLSKQGANKYHVDHVIPLVLGGSDWPSNLQCLCPTCNLRKGAKDPIVWAAENGRLL